MADSGFFSDTDESAVEEVISQAQDLYVLEQLSTLNCSAFSDSVLPSDLDSRFRRLKSFPVTVSHTTHINPDQDHFGSNIPSPHLEYPLKSTQPLSSPPSVSDSCPPDAYLSPSVPSHRSSSNCRSFASPLPLDSSPPKKSGCFWCSPKKLSKKNNKDHDNSMLGTALYSGEYVSNLATFSVKEHQKMLNKAIKEQDKISQKAEEIVNWAKQASARIRMTSPAIGSELHDSDDEGEPGK